MIRGSRPLLPLVLAIIFIPVCSAQSAPQHVRDYIYDPSGRLILTAEPSPYPPGMLPSFSAELAGECADSGVALDWGTATDVGPGIAGYNLYRDGSLLASFGVSTHDYTDYSVYGGSSYTYSVTSVDRAGNESDPTYQSVSVPMCICRYLFPELFPKTKKGSAVTEATLFPRGNRAPSRVILASRPIRLPAWPRYSQSVSRLTEPTKLFATASFVPARPPNLFELKSAPRKRTDDMSLASPIASAGGGR
jgi:hypothetical protein